MFIYAATLSCEKSMIEGGGMKGGVSNFREIHDRGGGLPGPRGGVLQNDSSIKYVTSTRRTSRISHIPLRPPAMSMCMEQRPSRATLKSRPETLTDAAIYVVGSR